MEMEFEKNFVNIHFFVHKNAILSKHREYYEIHPTNDCQIHDLPYTSE